MLTTADLPDDIAALKAMLLAADAEGRRREELIARLEKLVAAFKQAAFGRRSEKDDPDQFDLALEDLETAIAAVTAEDEAAPSPTKARKPRAANRDALPAHLPRIEVLVEPDSLDCACGGPFTGSAKTSRSGSTSSRPSSGSPSRGAPNTPAALAPMASGRRRLGPA